MNQSTSFARSEAGAGWSRGAGVAASTTVLMIGRISLAAGLLGLGVLGLATGDFAMNWQPVPAWVPGRTVLAYLAAGLSLILGAGLLIDRYRHRFTMATSAMFVVWAVLLHFPRVVADPLSVLPWLGFTERLEVAAGALMLARRRMLVGKIAFGACLPVFGLSHLAYPQFTADMIPAFIPVHLFWAYFTGIAHCAAGVAILTNVLARFAAVLFAVMVSGFVLLLHVPRIIADPGSRAEWTMIVVAMTIVGAAWCAAGSIGRNSAARTES